MLFNSLPFLAFFALLLGAYQLAPAQWRRPLLLAGSYGFYAAWDWRFLPLLLFSTLLDFHTGRALWTERRQARRKGLLGISLIGNLMPLAFFKYYNFLAENLATASNHLFGWGPPLPALSLILPVGISFYTFQTLSYSIDLYRWRARPARNLQTFALYVAFFPQLVAGPIEKARHLLPQLAQLAPLKSSNLRYGLLTLLYGLFCKAVLGDSCAAWSDAAFAPNAPHTPLESLLGALLFSVQIYMDFAGYSLMALGLAKCFGVRLSINFAQPYLSSNITAFWRRWHISLSSWLREYVYIPLGGNRKGAWRQYAHLMATMLIGGLWHGANWTFVAWGGLHGLALSLHKPWADWLGKKGLSVPVWLAAPFTFGFVSLTWVFFRAEHIGQALNMLAAMPHAFSGSLASPMWQPLFWCGGGMLALDIFHRRQGTHLFVRKWPIHMQYGILAAVLLVLLIYLAPQRPQPFIYFQF